MMVQMTVQKSTSMDTGYQKTNKGQRKFKSRQDVHIGGVVQATNFRNAKGHMENDQGP